MCNGTTRREEKDKRAEKNIGIITENTPKFDEKH